MPDDVEDLAVDQYPVLRRFRRSAVSGTQPQRDLYDMHRELSQVVRTIRKLGREGRVEEAKALRAEHPDLEKQYGAVQGRYESLRDLSSAIRRVRGFQKLEDVQQMADAWVRETKNSQARREVVESGAWEDAGALKRWLVDELRRAQSRSARGRDEGTSAN